MSRIVELKDQRFGRLLVAGFSHIDKHQHTCWHVECDCGNEKIIDGNHLRSGATQSCGCLLKEAQTKHGKSNTKTYRTWVGMKGRCLNPLNSGYKNYGGRGITICDRWMEFENFLADMGERLSGTSIERINNDGNYEPSNCKWIKDNQQASNTRKNVFLTHKGLMLTLSQWARKLGIPRNTIKSRRHRGLSIEKILGVQNCV